MKETYQIHRDTKFKVEIPWELHQAIIRIQAEQDLDFEEACKKAAMLVDPRRDEFKNDVKVEADRLAKSQFMQQLNKAKKTIESQAYERGADYVRNNEDNFRTPCSVCGKPIYFTSRWSNWEDFRKVLYQAYSAWYHGECKKQ